MNFFNKEFPLLKYDSGDGNFYWIGHSGVSRVGEVAGSIFKNGYVYISYKKKRFRAGRLAWFFVSGAWPDGQIDHINGDRQNNSINNLRVVSSRENNINRDVHRNGKLPGSAQVTSRRWIARRTINGIDVYLGSFHSEQEAHEAYLRATILGTEAK